jgi:cell division protein FtsZ
LINTNVSKRQQTAEQPSQAMSAEDKELEEFLNASLPNIYVFGVGGSGNNTLMRMNSIGVEGATTIALNTDAQTLIKTIADKKILIGKKK